jgi:hypothetical protein
MLPFEWYENNIDQQVVKQRGKVNIEIHSSTCGIFHYRSIGFDL